MSILADKKGFARSGYTIFYELCLDFQLPPIVYLWAPMLGRYEIMNQTKNSDSDRKNNWIFEVILVGDYK